MMIAVAARTKEYGDAYLSPNCGHKQIRPGKNLDGAHSNTDVAGERGDDGGTNYRQSTPWVYHVRITKYPCESLEYRW